MTITIGSSTFDNVFYDADGRLVGVTIVGAKSLIDRNGEITITLPEIVHVNSDTVAPALVGA